MRQNPTSCCPKSPKLRQTLAPKLKMVKKELSESETSETSSSDEEPKTPENGTTDYEKQRQSRIAENRARMELLGLRNIANSLMGSAEKSSRGRKMKGKSKRVVKEEVDDEDYKPIDEDDDDDDDDNDGDFDSSGDEFEEESGYGRKSRNRSKKMKKKTPMSGKKMSGKKQDVSEFMDEDEALMQAIALSLEDAGEISDRRPSGSSLAQAVSINEKGHGPFQEDNTRRRKRKSLSSRVQMTEDDLVINFCQLDEVGKGSITLRDLRRMAAIHDFTWTDKELADMIRCFDSDRDGKLTLDDFRNIVQRCNMLKGPETQWHCKAG